MISDNTYERYHHQIILKDFGEQGQLKLLQTKVLVIGAGGLGCPALQYLASAGIGTLGIIDDDVVDLSNLQRQVLYNVNDIGLSKVECAANVLRLLNPEIQIDIYHTRLINTNAVAIINQYDLILDCSDNFATRYLVNDACVILNKTFIYGAVSQVEGQVAIFNHSSENIPAVSYRDLFPEAPAENEILNCAEAGVLGVLPGIIGTMMANEVIKLVTGTGMPLINKLLTYNTSTNNIYKINLVPNKVKNNIAPKTLSELEAYNYELKCLIPDLEISIYDFNETLSKSGVAFVDVREIGEKPIVTEFDYLSIPLSQQERLLNEVPFETIILFCQTGKRSLYAAQKLSLKLGTSKKVYSLQGGIQKWYSERKVIIYGKEN